MFVVEQNVNEEAVTDFAKISNLNLKKFLYGDYLVKYKTE
jgi:hypothetical protein